MSERIKRKIRGHVELATCQLRGSSQKGQRGKVQKIVIIKIMKFSSGKKGFYVTRSLGGHG